MYLRVPAIRVVQPLGPFYVTCLKARDLLNITHSNALQVIGRIGETYDLAGGQREIQVARKKEISGFIETAEAAFPNSIILGANFDSEGKFVDDSDLRWRIEHRSDGESNILVIPKCLPLAAIIDGQHRLLGFENVSDQRLDMELPCSIYFDLPVPYQAYVFATINFNQKKVDKSLAYEMMAFDANAKSPETWAPETLAVHLSRKLNLDRDSPLFGHIRVAPINDELLFEPQNPVRDWLVSTATVVEGIVKLFSSNPQRDKSTMHQISVVRGRSRISLKGTKDSSPLRGLFIEVNDKAIYIAITNFFRAVSAHLWRNANEKSYIRKTVGIQALFDVLKASLRDIEVEKDISEDKFAACLLPSKNIDFSDDFFQASGTGRTRIRNCVMVRAGFVSIDDLPGDDHQQYNRLCTEAK